MSMAFPYQDVAQTNLRDLDEGHIVGLHLEEHSPIKTKDYAAYSTLYSLKKNMKCYRSGDRNGPFISIFCAFAILDQLGQTYKPRNVQNEPNVKNGIKLALHYFCELECTSPEVEALVALRNSIFHNGSLVSSCGKGNKKKHYIFRFDPKQKELIKLPSLMWNGKASGLSGDWKDSACIVNVNELIALAKRTIKHVYCSYKEGKVSLIGGGQEVLMNFILLMKQEEYDALKPL